jgi:protein arginine kinase activator
MKGKCDHCEKAAVVHDTTVQNGVKSEVHLCADHAAAAGYDMAAPAALPLFFTQLVGPKAEPAAAVSRKACRRCGLTFRAFRQNGLLGCPDCYEAFEEQLAPMIERAQGGALQHTGKFPQRGSASMERQLRMERLFRELKEAVDAEQYERAAELRDRLRALNPRTADRTGSGRPDNHG